MPAPDAKQYRSGIASTLRVVSQFFAVFILVGAAWAIDQSTITGTVVDPSGAAVVGASVALRNSATGTEQKELTDANGAYAVRVNAGRYQIAVYAAGFKRYSRGDVDVLPTTHLRLDVELGVEAHSDTVIVSAEESTVDTATSHVGNTIAAAKLIAIPVNGRGFTDLLALQPGIVPASSQQPNAVVMAGCAITPPSGDVNSGNTSVSGQRETSNGFMVNGSTVQEAFNMGTAIVPSLDSIQ